MFLGEGQDRSLDLPPEQVIGRLERVDRPNLLECRHLVGVEVRNAHEADEAFVNEPIERLGRGRDGRRRVRPVDLVDVDVVGAEEPEARLEVAA